MHSDYFCVIGTNSHFPISHSNIVND